MSVDQAVVDLSKQGVTCKRIAAQLGISEYQVWNIRQRQGVSGRHRGHIDYPETRKAPRAPLERALDEHDVVTIERGAAGGYIVTVDEHTGYEQDTIDGAIRDALNGGEA